MINLIREAFAWRISTAFPSLQCCRHALQWCNVAVRDLCIASGSLLPCSVVQWGFAEHKQSHSSPPYPSGSTLWILEFKYNSRSWHGSDPCQEAPLAILSRRDFWKPLYNLHPAVGGLLQCKGGESQMTGRLQLVCLQAWRTKCLDLCWLLTTTGALINSDDVLVCTYSAHFLRFQAFRPFYHLANLEESRTDDQPTASVFTSVKDKMLVVDFDGKDFGDICSGRLSKYAFPLHCESTSLLNPNS